MDKEITENLYFSKGLLKLDARERYEKMFGVIDHSNLSLDNAISKILETNLGSGCVWKATKKAPWIGNSPGGETFQVSHKEKTYFLKFVSSLEEQLGTILSSNYFSQPNKLFGVTEIVKHGVLRSGAGIEQYYQLMKGVPGKYLHTLIVNKDHKSFLKSIAKFGEMTAESHNKSSSEMTSYEKNLCIRYHPSHLIKVLADLPRQLNDAPPTKSYEKFLKLMVPEALGCAKDYLKTKQIQAPMLSYGQIANITYEEETDKIHFFDTDIFFRYCGPNSIPSWSVECPLASSYIHLRSVCDRFNLGEDFKTQCQQTLLNSYHNRVKKKVMTKEGVSLFLSYRHLREMKVLFEEKKSVQNFDDLFEKWMLEFKEYQQDRNKTVSLILGN